MFTECFWFPFSPVHFDSVCYPTCPVIKFHRHYFINELHFLNYSIGISSHFKPAKMFINELFPAPEGPKITERWPDLKTPLIRCRICLVFFPKNIIRYKLLLFHKLVNCVWITPYFTFSDGITQIAKSEIQWRTLMVFSSFSGLWTPIT